MNRYHILIGKESPPANSETYLAGLDIGKGDSTPVIRQFVQRPTGASSLPLVNSKCRTLRCKKLRNRCLRYTITIYWDEHFQVGDIVGTDECGTVCKIKEGLIPIGIVEQLPDAPSNNTIIIRNFMASEQVSAEENAFHQIPRISTGHLGKLHEHPNMQREKSIPSDHVIVDRADWIEARRDLSSEQI